jgi:proteic killer suppression protein
MIRSFKHRGLRQLWESGTAAGITPSHEQRATRILDALEASTRPDDMAAVPGYRFHPLKGDRAGWFSVTVSGNWRITFRWDGLDAIDVNYEDYH